MEKTKDTNKNLATQISGKIDKQFKKWQKDLKDEKIARDFRIKDGAWESCLKKDYADMLKNKCHTDDDEDNHILADKLLCELLKALGFDKVVAEYEKVNKYCA
jgi:hypothetical protein